jgi:two-component system, LuxR family, sensor kinase FixL
MSEICQASKEIDLPEPANREPKLASWPGTVVLLLALLVTVTLLGGYWLHGEVTRALETPYTGGDPAASIGTRLKDLSNWQLTATLFTAGTGVVLITLAIAGFNRIRRSWEEEWQVQSATWEETCRNLRAQLSEKRKIEIGLREQLIDLQSKLNALIRSSEDTQAELSRLKLAEEISNYQHRELTRSKDVLELHVQARAQQLQKLQRTYELILNSAGEGICGLDYEGKITFVNPAAAKMMGAAIPELVGRPAPQVFPHFMTNGHSESGHRNGEHTTEVVATRRDGTTFGAEFLRTPLREGDRIIGEVLLFKDITERKQAQETLTLKAAELARSNAELEQFAFVASHDLQEPLRKIQAFGDRLKMKCAAVNLEEGRDYLDRMQGAAARMQTLIYDLLTFSRVISRTEPFVPVDLKTVAREVIGDLEVRLEKTGGRVEIGELPTIEADALQMRQLLLNLIGNALKFHAPGTAPVVRLQSRLATPGAATEATGLPQPPGEPDTEIQFHELTVADNGIGFDEKYLDRIFAVFQRLHGRQEYEGTGIGLAVCRRIVDRHGGTITARSKPGEGATFIFTLPARQPVKAKGGA